MKSYPNSKRILKGRFEYCLIILLGLLILGNAPELEADEGIVHDTKITGRLSLDECIQIAIGQSHHRPASVFAVAAAEAQHRQALAGYWPHLTIKGGFQRMDETPDFLFPAGSMQIPAQSMNIPAGAASVTIPANAFGPGFPPANVTMPVGFPSQTINVQAQQFPIPEQHVKLMDRDSWLSSLDVQWLLWDGGMRKSLREQAQAAVDVARQGLRRTDLQIIDSVKRLYYGAVLARQVHRVGRDTLERMQATLNLTETMYKEGAGSVKKTDFLNNKIMVETLCSAVAQLEKNETMTQAALAYTMGMAWNASVIPKDDEIPFVSFDGKLEQLVSKAYEFSPDWKSLEAGICALEGALSQARSEQYPKLALTGNLHRWWNNYNAGMATEANKKGWTIGVGMELPIFRGFLTRNKIEEVRSRLGKIREEGFLLREGIGLQIRNIFLGLNAAAKGFQASFNAMTAAIENRDLNTRAYQSDLVETEDVITAQLMEALMSVQHFKNRYDHVELLSKLDLVVGTEVTKKLTGEG